MLRYQTKTTRSLGLISSILILGLLCCYRELPAQTKIDNPSNNKYGLALIPSAANNIYGIAIGPIGSESICGQPYYKRSYGINIQVLGQGLLWVFNKKPSPGRLFRVDTTRYPIDTLIKYDKRRAIHNGVLVSPLGAIQTSLNGVNVSAATSEGNSLKGISISGQNNQFNRMAGICLSMINNSGKIKGIQIGLINKTHELKGLQIGL